MNKKEDKRGYRTASEYAAAAAARIQVNENGFVDINKVVHENNELRHKVVYIGSRCEQIEAEYTQTKEYLNSELKKANDQTEAVRQEKMELEEKYKELEKRCAALDLELIEARDRSDELEGELCAIRQLQVQRYREFLNPLSNNGSSDEDENWTDQSLLVPRETTII